MLTKRESGRGKSKPWKFFDDMDQICGHRDIIHPTSLLDTSLSQPPNNVDDDNDALKGNFSKQF